MWVLVRRPPAVLAPFVEYLAYYEWAAEPARDCVVPLRTTHHLMVNLAEDRMRWYAGPGLSQRHEARGAVLFGPRLEPIGVEISVARAVRIGLRPGGAVPLFRDVVSHRDEPLLDLETLWGRNGSSFRDRLLEAPTPEAVLAGAAAALLERVVAPLEPDHVLAATIGLLDRNFGVAQVADRLGLTDRTLLRRFTAGVGMGPKQYARVLRLHRLLDAVPVDGEVDWARLAVECGYFDQAHLINDFRALTGTTPGTYRPRAGSPSHVPLER